MVSLKLLGRPQIKYQGDWLEPRPSKPFYLLLYIAYCGEWLNREKLALLFWPDTSERKSQQNLRSLIEPKIITLLKLSRLKNSGYAGKFL